jgi:GalNAc-alpha-(1->4)-GalNAc-alpha-(1->3)-diNAcBac-PP-undecaprenol alpha-1,4-N-acetyl-D-galactosaminyltransferase
MRIRLIISSMGALGAERVMWLLAGGLSGRGLYVTLLTFAPVEDDFFSIDTRVDRIALGMVSAASTPLGKAWQLLRRISGVRRVILTLQPDIVVSFITETNTTALLASFGIRSRTIVSVRVDPLRHHPPRVWRWLRRVTYFCACVLVAQTADVASWFVTELVRAPPIAVIQNPVLVDAQTSAPAVVGVPSYLLGAGQLTPQKSFDLLIRGLAMLVDDGISANLIIAGDSSEEAALRRLATDLGVGTRVQFPGRVRNPGRLMVGAAAFVLPSRYEGFPNFLEALARGVSVNAADCPSGPREIMKGGEAGILVRGEDAEELASAIRGMLADGALQERLRISGPLVARTFSVEAVTLLWERVSRQALQS